MEHRVYIDQIKRAGFLCEAASAQDISNTKRDFCFMTSLPRAISKLFTLGYRFRTLACISPFFEQLIDRLREGLFLKSVLGSAFTKILQP